MRSEYGVRPWVAVWFYNCLPISWEFHAALANGDADDDLLDLFLRHPCRLTDAPRLS